MSWTADRIKTESQWPKYRADDLCICPDCNGQSVTVWGSTCHTCDGLGELRHRDIEMIRRMPGGDWR